jgi:tripartite-type tricarboxylate transporter receptor subunit TctC
MTMHRRRQLLAGIVTLGVGGMPRAQTGAARDSITLIIPSLPGSSSDTMGRLLAEALGAILETQVKVENIGGNAGVTGTNAIAVAPRDGSVIGLALSSPLIAGKLLSRSAQYNPSEGFDWLGIVGTYPNAMVLSTRSNHSTIEQWLATARVASVPLTYASLGTGTAGHLAEAYLKFEQGARLVHATMPTLEEGYASLAAGRIEVLFDGIPSATVKVPRTGHRVVAVTSSSRVAAFPDAPSFGELWQQSFVVWIGLVTPKGVPPDAFARLASAVGVLFAEPRHAETLRAAGLAHMGLSGLGTKAFVEAEILRNAKLIARLNDEGLRQ